MSLTQDAANNSMVPSIGDDVWIHPNVDHRIYAELLGGVLTIHIGAARRKEIRDVVIQNQQGLITWTEFALKLLELTYPLSVQSITTNRVTIVATGEDDSETNLPLFSEYEINI